MKKKILFAITKGTWGGAQKYVFDLATEISQHDFEVTVLCGTGGTLAAKLAEHGVRVIELPDLARDVSLSKDFASFYKLYETLRAERPDILHLNSSKMGAMGALAGRLARVPKIIFTGHGWAWNENRSFLSKTLITIIHWLTVLLTHHTITVSQKTKSEVERLPFINPSKLELIYNGVHDVDYIERFAARAELGSTISEKFWIGTISELHKNKGLDTLVRAFADLAAVHPNTTLVIIGEGEERRSLTSLIARLGLRKQVHLLGFKENASRFLKSLDVFVLSSRTEAFPYVILEAGLAQLPVVATRVGGIPEVIIDQNNGLLVPSGNTFATANALRILLEDSAQAAELGHNLRKTVEERFSVDTMVQKTIAVYNLI
jgi:glycosyltransferase involved in cell wall biosynthesis